MSATSFIYFRAGDATDSIQSRLFIASHGFLGTLVFIIAILTASIGQPSPHLREPYLMLWLVPLLFIGVSIARFKGPKHTHLLLAPLLAAMGWAIVLGHIIVGGGK